jgi:hypothetical protein
MDDVPQAFTFTKSPKDPYASQLYLLITKSDAPLSCKETRNIEPNPRRFSTVLMLPDKLNSTFRDRNIMATQKSPCTPAFVIQIVLDVKDCRGKYIFTFNL